MEEKKSIDQAIDVLDKLINKHSKESRKIIAYLFSIIVFLTILISMFFLRDLPYYVIYAIFGSFIVVFAVLISIYRFHLTEISKAEQWKIGFMRIRIAANNLSEGFKSEVRQALTDGAFQIPSQSSLFSKGQRLENPLPGHPSSEISTIALNKILDMIEVKLKDKQTG